MKKVISSLLIVLFFIIPICGVITADNDKIFAHEKRKINAFPTEFNSHFFAKVGDFVVDRLLFKDLVLDNLYKFYRDNFTQFFADPSVMGVRGSAFGWYFLGDGYNKVMSQHIRPLSLSLNNITSITKDVNYILEIKDRYHVPLDVIVGCDKHGIYHEYMPELVKHSVFRAFDEIKPYYDRAGLSVFDPLTTLQSHKNDEYFLYYKNDTHWNEMAGFIVFKDYMQRTYGDVKLLEYKLTPSAKEDGDMALRDSLDTDIDAFIITPSFYRNIKYSVFNLDGKKEYSKEAKGSAGIVYDSKKAVYSYNENAPIDESILFYSDSFGVALINLFRDHFKEVLAVRDGNNEAMTKLVEQEQFKADRVIRVKVERSFYIP